MSDNMRMIMSLKCPHCGEELEELPSSILSWVTDEILLLTYDGRCDKCYKNYIISEELHVVSRLVGKDGEDIDRLIDEEDELVDVKKVTLKK